MAEELLAAEVLVIGVLHPARAQHLVRQRMHVLEDEETGDQPGRQRRLAGARRADRGEAPFQKAPVDLLCQPDQRVTHIDDPLQGRPEQILLPLIARLRHRFPRAISARSRNHDPPQIGIANCKKPQPNPAFPAKSITRSSQIVPLSQRYPNSSRATPYMEALRPSQPFRNCWPSFAFWHAKPLGRPKSAERIASPQGADPISMSAECPP